MFSGDVQHPTVGGADRPPQNRQSGGNREHRQRDPSDPDSSERNRAAALAPERRRTEAASARVRGQVRGHSTLRRIRETRELVRLGRLRQLDLLPPHRGQLCGLHRERIVRGQEDADVLEHLVGGAIAATHVRHRTADDPAQRVGAALGDLRQAPVGRELVLDQVVEHGPGRVEVELDPVDVLDLHALHRLPDQFGVAVVLGAVGRQRHRRGQRSHQAEIHELDAVTGDHHVVRLDVLVPQPRTVEARQDAEQTRAIAHHRAQGLLVQPVRSAGRVQPATDFAQVFTRHERHHVMETGRRQLVLEDQSEIPRGLECSALPHDLGQGRAALEREGLDHHTVGHVQAGLGQLRLLLVQRVGEVELRSGPARRERADDLVAVEARLASGRTVGTRRTCDDVGDPLLQAVEQRAQADQVQRVADRAAVEGEDAVTQLRSGGATVVIGCRPAPESDVPDHQRDEEDRGHQRGHVPDRIDDDALQAAEDVSHEPADATEDLAHACDGQPEPLDQDPDHQHADTDGCEDSKDAAEKSDRDFHHGFVWYRGRGGREADEVARRWREVGQPVTGGWSSRNSRYRW